MLLSLSELTPYQISFGLTHLGSEAYKCYKFQLKTAYQLLKIIRNKKISNLLNFNFIINRLLTATLLLWISIIKLGECHLCPPSDELGPCLCDETKSSITCANVESGEILYKVFNDLQVKNLNLIPQKNK